MKRILIALLVAGGLSGQTSLDDRIVQHADRELKIYGWSVTRLISLLAANSKKHPDEAVETEVVLRAIATALKAEDERFVAERGKQ